MPDDHNGSSLPANDSGKRITYLCALMARLRHPTHGCAWDRRQTFASIAPYTLEEAYEVADAIAEGDTDALREELGDLLLQVVFHARIAEEAGLFSFGDVVDAICDKMVRRNPDIFADAPAATPGHWERMKEEERKAKGVTSAMDGITRALPALMRAVKVQGRAARVGFDWTDLEQVFAKIAEETVEIRAALATGAPEAVADEVGDLLFSVANLARHLKIDPETALRMSTGKFERRFRFLEPHLTPQSSQAERDALWEQAKAHAE